MFKVNGWVKVIKTHSQGFVKKGEKYTVLAIMSLECGCIAIDLGLRDPSSKIITKCECGTKFFSDNITWIDSKILRPIDEDFANQTLDCILRKVKEEEIFAQIKTNKLEEIEL